MGIGIKLGFIVPRTGTAPDRHGSRQAECAEGLNDNQNGSINDNATKEEVINLCKDISNIDLIEGRFACINVDNANNLSILTDRFGRFDVYINESENNIYISVEILDQ